eukprot:NODE_596_length_858_cov_682.216316_g450_i0.p1 GENE.NODE_596_length_858_cov_682.216316_g450_i0~~NODE_596_length_858_cov_682.216316_g450_i0.p1  ORF type:complete len:253 (+),score=57.99 NODE_596_length_858_cov_682.216316_g450_i0:29-760(+)
MGNAALKICPRTEFTEQEIRLAVRIPPHANVVSIYGMVTDSDRCCLLTEFCQYGDLHTLLCSQTQPLDAPELDTFAMTASAGMLHLAGTGMVHRDVAARNMLVSDDGTVKVTDFGMSVMLVTEQQNGTYISSGQFMPFRWMAPEALERRKYSEKSDVWSFGLVLYEIYSMGKIPFEDASTPEDLAIRLSEGELPGIPPAMTARAAVAMGRCLVRSATERAIFKEINTILSVEEKVLIRSSNYV